MKFHLPRSTNNMLSLAGVIIVVVGFCVFWFLFLLAQMNLISPGAYFGLVLYVFIPVPSAIGLILIPIGMYRYNKRKAKIIAGEVKQFPVIDLNIKRHRNAAAIFSIGTIVFGFLIVFISYHGYHYTSSSEFCGTLCHTVMEPEFVTYTNSSHSRVNCTECHVGAGADWYARSKLSGLYQVYATIRDIYPRPIETPIKHLRPARETCEQCHWPEKFFSARQRIYHNYLSDEENTPWAYNILLEIGGGVSKSGKASGSHWHVHPDNKVEYITTDKKRQVIPWIRWTNQSTGRQIIYNSEDSPLSDEEIAEAEIRTMDCMDCHNRPTHVYIAPDEAVNRAIADGSIDRSITEIKMISMEVLTAEYTNKDSALIEIGEKILSYYSGNYPEIADKKAKEIKSAVSAVRDIYLKNFFPEMKANWSYYPDNLGHKNFPGCYRCHDGKHISKTEQKISHNCNSCHLIIAQGNEINKENFESKGLEFKHPVDIDVEWKTTGCYECHTGGIQ